jgi:hypothetical protein
MGRCSLRGVREATLPLLRFAFGWPGIWYEAQRAALRRARTFEGRRRSAALVDSRHGMSSGSNEIKDSLVVGRSNQGIEIRGSLLRLTRFAVVFEIYSPTIVLRLS